MIPQKSPKIKFVDLFCGMGGFRLAMDSIESKCVFSSDINPHARQIYQENFGDLPHGDITKINEKAIPAHDVLVGGFPCQSFSVAGHQKGFEDSRGTLFFDIARIVKFHRPKVLILENVKNLLTHDKGNTFKVIQETLEYLGYDFDYAVLNAKYFGVPQNRERLVMVANRLNKTFDFTKLKRKPCLSMRDFLPERGYFYLSPNEHTLLNENEINYNQSSGLIFCGYRNKTLRITGVKNNTSHLSRSHKQPNRIYSINGVHPTLSSQEVGGRYFVKDDYGVRKLSVEECLLLMGYDPSKYKITGSMTSMYSRIGNSICVPLFRQVAKEVKRQLFYHG